MFYLVVIGNKKRKAPEFIPAYKIKESNQYSKGRKEQ